MPRPIPRNIPSIDAKRWTARSRAAVVLAIANGRISLKDACTRYDAAPEEIAAWQRAYRAEGLGGLRMRKLAGR